MWRITYTVQRQGISHIIKERTATTEVETSLKNTAIWEGGLLIAVKKYKKTMLLKKPKIKSPGNLYMFQNADGF